MVVVLHGPSVELENHVVRADSGQISRRAPGNGLHPRADGPHHAEPVGLLADELSVERHAEVGPGHRAVLHELPGHKHHHRDRDREADSLTAAGVAGDRRVEPHDLAAEVHQRPPAVARIDRGIGLDEVLKLDVAIAQIEVSATFRRDDAERHRMRQAKRATNREHGVADSHGVAVGEPSRLQILGVDLHDRDVGARVGPEPLGIQLAAVVEPDRDVFESRAVDDVPIGDHGCHA